MVTKQDPITSEPEPEANNDLGLWEQIKEDWIAHKCDWTKPGFRAIAVQRFGVWRIIEVERHLAAGRGAGRSQFAARLGRDRPRSGDWRQRLV